MTQTKLSKLLKQYNPIILDGAMATEIEKHGIALDSELWSAAVIQEHPEVVKQVHLDYFKSGADIATTNTYQATLLGFQQSGYSEQEAERIISKRFSLLLMHAPNLGEPLPAAAGITPLSTDRRKRWSLRCVPRRWF
ncbi:homocysteine S-methyltransferase [Sporolactobacillus inulinus]|uniref:Homocysteine S-methyltransferase n=1 Tax=Sporolactobacillus inulinus TaxID=2078 RepID=A0A4Y1ZC66_9BACL|nr:homocysteine S-methyltransferase family protein [Sporolactobacillus inulinus]GAY76645.1 homocysteine S-methyltransferase [Sporolactobacillus inulinus]